MRKSLNFDLLIAAASLVRNSNISWAVCDLSVAAKSFILKQQVNFIYLREVKNNIDIRKLINFLKTK